MRTDTVANPSCSCGTVRPAFCFRLFTLFLSLSVFLSVSVSLCISVSLCLPLSLFLFLSLPVSLCLSIPLCLSVSLCLSQCLLLSLSLCLLRVCVEVRERPLVTRVGRVPSLGRGNGGGPSFRVLLHVESNLLSVLLWSDEGIGE